MWARSKLSAKLLSKPCSERPPTDRAPRLSACEFAAEFARSFRSMWLIAVSIVGDTSMAEDVVQEAALVALRKLEQFEVNTNFRAWVGQIVRNIALNTLRSETRRRRAMLAISAASGVPTAVDGDGMEALVAPPVASSPGFDGRIALALQEMGDVARACVLLRTIGELQYSEIAELLDIPEGTAMSHVHRSRQHLRERLADVWAEQVHDRMGGGMG